MEWRAGARLPDRVAQRIDSRHQQARPAVEQVHCKEEGSSWNPIAAVVRHDRSMPGLGERRNALPLFRPTVAGAGRPRRPFERVRGPDREVGELNNPNPAQQQDRRWRQLPSQSYRFFQSRPYILPGILILAAAVYFAIPMHRVVQSTPPTDPQAEITNRSRTEYAAAWDDHYAVTLWFARCRNVFTVGELPNVVAKELGPYGEAEWVGTGTGKIEIPNQQLWQVVQLSKNIYRERLANSGNVKAAYKTNQVMQWLIIILGLITTIVVALATNYGTGQGSGKATLRVFAIMLPAFGTAAAAVNAFYAPSQEVARGARTLSSLTQLHNQIAVEVWGAKCDGDAKDPDSIVSKTAQWTKRYQDIQSLAGTGGETQQGTGAAAKPPTP